MATALAEITRRAVSRFGTKRALAEKLNISESQVGRIANGEVTSASVETCLRLAQFTAESPGVVLEAASKQEVLELIERFFGRSRERAPVHLATDEEQLLTRWRSLSSRDRRLVEAVLTTLATVPKGPRHD